MIFLKKTPEKKRRHVGNGNMKRAPMTTLKATATPEKIRRVRGSPIITWEVKFEFLNHKLFEYYY